MQQKINLYKISDRPKAGTDDLLSWQRFWLSQLLFLVFLILLYGFEIWHMRGLKHEKDIAEKQTQQLKNEFERRRAALPEQFFNQDINTALVQLKKNLAEQQRILESIANPSLFSEDLAAFSRLVVPNIWLTAIQVTEGGKIIICKGHSLGLNTLKSFVENISQDKTFQHYRLEIKNVENMKKDDSHRLAFEIQLTKKS